MQGGGSAKAIYDAGAPVMKSQQVTDLGLDKATIKIVTNEATNVTVNYGILPSQIILSHSSANASAKLAFTSKGGVYATSDVTRHRSILAEVSSARRSSFVRAARMTFRS